MQRRGLRSCGRCYFTMSVRKLGSVCVWPLNVAVNVIVYVPGSVAPIGFFARLPQAAVPSATVINVNTANVSATRLSRRIIKNAPHSSVDKRSSFNAVPVAPGPKIKSGIAA